MFEKCKPSLGMELNLIGQLVIVLVVATISTSSYTDLFVPSFQTVSP